MSRFYAGIRVNAGDAGDVVEPIVTRLPRVVYTERPTVAEIDTARGIDEGKSYATGREGGPDHRRCRGCRRTTHGLRRGGLFCTARHHQLSETTMCRFLLLAA